MLIRFVTIGHVDTGKSTLCGHLLYKCGFVSDHDFNKIKEKAKKDKMEKWIWARILDIYEEEMIRGKTHEFNEINFEFKDNIYQLIDTPGHQTYIRSMIDGISRNVNIAVLMVSMIENEFNASFDKGMLKEHLFLAKFVGIQNLIIVANKMDIINWDQDIYNSRISKVKQFLNNIQWKEQFTYYIPISSYLGHGLTDLDNIPDWYKGLSFLETLNTINQNINNDNANDNKLILSNCAIVKTMILNSLDSIISGGFECIGHYQGKEIEINFDKILNDNKTLKTGQRSKSVIKLKEPINLYHDMRIILRKDDNTVGLIRIDKIKPYIK